MPFRLKFGFTAQDKENYQAMLSVTVVLDIIFGQAAFLYIAKYMKIILPQNLVPTPFMYCR